ncbi:hypothetical protein F5Y14DRAFT_460530 [Nemania sp. NC0429]|nr:hypothetical protein F5Y14DRAFT_460530 [Nemania sp. NC0429]
MAGDKASENGHTCPLPQAVASRTDPQLDPEPKAKPFASKPVRSLTPRGQRFSKLSDAYFNITSRQGSHHFVPKDLDQSHTSIAASSLVAPASSPITGPRLVKSQDDLQTPSSASAVPNSMKGKRCASFGSIECFEDLVPNMGRRYSTRLSLSQKTGSESTNPKAEFHDTTSSTIEGILAQYDAPAPGFKVEHDDVEECQLNDTFEFNFPLPPRGSLPEPPPRTKHHTYHMRLSESDCDSRARDSSITDSQYLLDAEAQAYELAEAGRALIPRPLNLGQPRHSGGIPQQRQCGASHNIGGSIAYQGEASANDLSSHREPGDYGKTQHLHMEREISQKLRHASRNIGHGVSTPYSSGIDENFIQPAIPRREIFSQSYLPTASTEGRPLRHIKVVIGRDPQTGEDNRVNCGLEVNVRDDCHNVTSEDGDWVTEATSDAGFDTCTDPLPGHPVAAEFKRAGSSLADYSDDGSMGRSYGSQERIIEYPDGDTSYDPYDVQRSNESKFAMLLPHQHNAFTENANRRWESATQQEPALFRPQPLHKSTNPHREVNGRRQWTPQRLVFDFDQNAPPRYEFRDSVSEYEPASASTKANCGTYRCDTYGSLVSPELEIGEGSHPSTADVHFDRSADFNAYQSPSTRFPQQNKTNQAPRQDQNKKLSIYAVDRQRQLDEMEGQEFAAASSYYDQPSANSVKSKFNFELLPLKTAQQKNKLQRDSGQTNETESAATRLKRKKTASSDNPETLPLQPPARAFFTSRHLSINFTPSEWEDDMVNQDDTAAPFAMGRSNNSTSGKRRKSRNGSWLEIRNTPSSFGAPTRRFFFYFLVVLSILPFVGVLVLAGACKEALKWATQGEVDRLTARQRRFIKIMLLAECILYTGGVATIVVYFAVKSKTEN